MILKSKTNNYFLRFFSGRDLYTKCLIFVLMQSFVWHEISSKLKGSGSSELANLSQISSFSDSFHNFDLSMNPKSLYMCVLSEPIQKNKIPTRAACAAFPAQWSAVQWSINNSPYALNVRFQGLWLFLFDSHRSIYISVQSIMLCLTYIWAG